MTFDMSEGDQNFIDEHCKSRRHARFYRHKEEDKKLADAADNDEDEVQQPSTSRASQDDGAEETVRMEVEEDD